MTDLVSQFLSFKHWTSGLEVYLVGRALLFILLYILRIEIEIWEIVVLIEYFLWSWEGFGREGLGRESLRDQEMGDLGERFWDKRGERESLIIRLKILEYFIKWKLFIRAIQAHTYIHVSGRLRLWLQYQVNKQASAKTSITYMWTFSILFHSKAKSLIFTFSSLSHSNISPWSSTSKVPRQTWHLTYQLGDWD